MKRAKIEQFPPHFFPPGVERFDGGSHHPELKHCIPFQTMDINVYRRSPSDGSDKIITFKLDRLQKLGYSGIEFTLKSAKPARYIFPELIGIHFNPEYGWTVLRQDYPSDKIRVRQFPLSRVVKVEGLLEKTEN